MEAVTAALDLNLLPFHRLKGQEAPILPGLRIIAPPRRPARGREEDQLIVFLSLAGNMPLPAAEQDRLVTTLAERFHRSPGALTSALRAGADFINQALVERNMRTTGKGQYLVGRLILGVLRGEQLFLALCGPVHVLHHTGGQTRHVHEEQTVRNGLGASQTTPIHFTQIDLHPGDLVALCAALPSGWEAALQQGHATFDLLRKSLLTVTQEDLSAILVQVRAGKGILTLLRGAVTPVEARPAPVPAVVVPDAPPPSGPAPEPAPAIPTSQVASEQPASRFARLLAGQEAGGSAPEQEIAAAPELPVSAPQEQVLPAALEPQPEESSPAEGASRPLRLITRPATARLHKPGGRASRFVSPPGEGGETPEISRPVVQKRQQTFRGLAKWMRGVQVFTRSTGEKLRQFLPNLLPGGREGEPRLTGMSMVFVVVVIPLLVVMIAMTFYNKHGRTASYQENYEQAWAASVWAAAQTNPADIRVGWERTLYYLNIADDYQDTDEAVELRARAQLALDNLDSILRLDFSPAIVGGLSQTVEVTHLAATNTDLYVLDGARGTVLRFYLGLQGYLADTQFSCSPGTYGGVRVGELVDIVAAPKVNTFSATLIAMDGVGNLLFCRPSPSEPTAVQLAAPSLGWRSIGGFTLDPSSGYLYVIDPVANAAWVYAPDRNGEYTNLPVMFFGAQVPAGMESAIDMVTNGADLYLLFQDGHIAACTLLEFQGVPKRCSDPAQFVDNRPDRTAGISIADALFTQMTFAEAPDQALYLFDPLAQAVYRFSPRPDSLILQGQFRAAEDDRLKMLVSTATAMTISPNRYIFISISGQVYYATDVP
jgi:hypothetical protein